MSENRILTENLVMRIVSSVWLPAFSHKDANEWPCRNVSGELRPDQRRAQFPRPGNNLRRKLGALLQPKIETRKFVLGVTWFFTKKEGAIPEIDGEGHMVVFLDSRRPVYQHTVPKKVKIDVVYCNSYSGIFEWRGQTWSINGFCTTITFDRTP